jgi:hypothetical protein
MGKKKDENSKHLVLKSDKENTSIMEEEAKTSSIDYDSYEHKINNKKNKDSDDKNKINFIINNNKTASTSSCCGLICTKSIVIIFNFLFIVSYFKIYFGYINFNRV